MARVHANRTATAPVRTGALKHKTNEQRKSSHKVIIEEITEKKKKLHTTLSFKTQPPPGYRFLAAGNPRLSSKCKDIARAQGLTVYIVSASNSKSKALSEQVGRLGYHFPSAVVQQACHSLGLTWAETSTQQPLRRSQRTTRRDHAKGRQNAKPRANSVGSDIDQSEIDARAASAIRDLFPKIPEGDVQIIVAQAFQKGMGKVGTASDQPFIRRVHLAVGAYIRHTYTDYDRLLKSHGYLNARTMVEPSTLDKIIEWRDEKDDPDAVEDILREVVVISDDEDEDNVDDFFDDGGSSVEIASSCEITDEVHVQPIHYGTLDKSSRIQRPVSPEDDWAPSVKFIRRLSTPQERIVRHHAQRYQKWQEAISRRKHAVNSGHDYIDEPTNLTGAGLRSSRNHPYQPKGVDHTNGGYYLKPVGHAIAGENDAFKPATRMVLDQHRRSGMDNVSKSLPLVIPPCIAMGTDAQRKPWKSFESSRLRSEQLDLQDSPSYPAIHYTPRPIHEMHGTKETVGRDYSIPQRQAARTQGFSIHQPVYFEPETLIPSVESDPHIPKRQEQHLGSNGPVATQRQLHGHFSGPRIVGPDDDPTSPVHKRRRVVGDGFPSPKVMYSTHGDHNHSVLVPRNQSIYGIHPTSEQSRNALPPSEASWYGQQTQHTMGSAPVAGRVHRVPNDGPMRGDGQNRTGLMAQENRVPGMFPGMRSEYQQRVPSPSMQSSRFEGFVPPGQVSHRFPSGSNPAIEMHESSRSPRPVYSGSAALYAEKHLPNVERVRFIQPVERGWQEMSSRLKPSHPVDHNHGAYTYDRPEMDRTHGREIDSILSKAEAPSPLSHPPSQHREHGSNVVSFPRLSKLDCPMAVRGSFCNRVGQNGFTREDHCREHLRLVHRYDTGQAGEMDQGRIIGPPQVQNGGQFASQYSDTSAEERHKERPPDWQRNGHHRSAQEREVVYITSSPLRGEGYSDKQHQEYMCEERHNPPLVHDVNGRGTIHGRQVPSAGYHNGSPSNKQSRQPPQVILLD